MLGAVAAASHASPLPWQGLLGAVAAGDGLTCFTLTKGFHVLVAALEGPNLPNRRALTHTNLLLLINRVLAGLAYRCFFACVSVCLCACVECCSCVMYLCGGVGFATGGAAHVCDARKRCCLCVVQLHRSCAVPSVCADPQV